ncbi:MAG: hypothetical protein JWN30_2223 [Bacilli bacterium]|nr:hypothetical protein [Bacilli bacterium]
MIWVGIGLTVVIIIWIAANIIAYRSIQQKEQTKSNLAAQAAEDTPPRAKEELERLSDILAEIEAGKGKEPETAEEVDFASVHSSIISKRPGAAELTSDIPHTFRSSGPFLPAEIQLEIADIEADPATMVWLLFQDKQVVRQSSSMEEQVIQLFVTWKELLDQTEEVLTMSGLNRLDLTGPEGHVLIKCKGDYTFITLLETA